VEKILELLKGKLSAEEMEGLKSTLADTLTETIEEQVTGLKAKNTELILKMKKLRESDGGERKNYELEDELEKMRDQVKELQTRSERETKKLLAEREKLTAELNQKTESWKRTEADRALTQALSGKVKDPVLLKAVKSMLSQGLEAQEESGTVKTLYKTDKGLIGIDDFVETWSQSEEGKRFVSASANSGGGATGSREGGGAKVMKSQEFNLLAPKQQAEFMNSGGTLE